jgi:hypothetical protein
MLSSEMLSQPKNRDTVIHHRYQDTTGVKRYYGKSLLSAS